MSHSYLVDTSTDNVTIMSDTMLPPDTQRKKNRVRLFQSSPGIHYKSVAIESNDTTPSRVIRSAAANMLGSYDRSGSNSKRQSYDKNNNIFNNNIILSPNSTYSKLNVDIGSPVRLPDLMPTPRVNVNTSTHSSYNYTPITTPSNIYTNTRPTPDSTAFDRQYGIERKRTSQSKKRVNALHTISGQNGSVPIQQQNNSNIVSGIRQTPMKPVVPATPVKQTPIHSRRTSTLYHHNTVPHAQQHTTPNHRPVQHNSTYRMPLNNMYQLHSALPSATSPHVKNTMRSRRTTHDQSNAQTPTSKQVTPARLTRLTDISYDSAVSLTPVLKFSITPERLHTEQTQIIACITPTTKQLHSVNQIVEQDYFEQSYTNLGCIGQGSFGIVYVCKFKPNDTICAVKKSIHPFRNKSHRLDCLQEVHNYIALCSSTATHSNNNSRHASPYRTHMLRSNTIVNNTTLTELGSDHIVQYIQAFEQKQHLYIHSELYAHGTLRTMLDQLDNPLNENVIYELLVDLLLGLRHIHTHKLIHLDIKPANIFVTNEYGGRLRIGDFGLATKINDSAEEGDSMYLAPELLDKHLGSASHTSDIFAVGLILYELCAHVNLPTRGDAWQKLRQNDIDFTGSSFIDDSTHSSPLTQYHTLHIPQPSPNLQMNITETQSPRCSPSYNKLSPQVLSQTLSKRRRRGVSNAANSSPSSNAHVSSCKQLLNSESFKHDSGIRLHSVSMDDTSDNIIVQRSAELHQLIRSMLQRNPTDRPSADTLLQSSILQPYVKQRMLNTQRQWPLPPALQLNTHRLPASSYDSMITPLLNDSDIPSFEQMLAQGLRLNSRGSSQPPASPTRQDRSKLLSLSTDTSTIISPANGLFGNIIFNDSVQNTVCSVDATKTSPLHPNVLPRYSIEQMTYQADNCAMSLDFNSTFNDVSMNLANVFDKVT